METLRTFHEFPYITYETVNNTQRLYASHPSLLLGQSV